MTAFAARHSALLTAALLPLAEKTQDDSTLALIAEAIGCSDTAALITSRFDTVFAFSWPYVTIGDQEVVWGC